MSFQVRISYFATVVEGEHHLAPDITQAGPATAGDGLSQRVEVPSHIVRFQIWSGPKTERISSSIASNSAGAEGEAAACTRLQLIPA